MSDKRTSFWNPDGLSIKNVTDKSQENVTLSTQFTTTTVINLFVFILFFVILFGLSQTRSMIIYGYEQITYGPLSTTFLVAFFSYASFVLSRFAYQIRLLKLKSRNVKSSKFIKDDLLTLFVIITPLLIHIALILFISDLGIIKKILFSLLSLVLLLIIVLMNISSERNIITETDKGEVSLQRKELAKKVKQSFHRSLVILLIVAILITAYFLLTTFVISFFTGDLGIAIFDISLLYLIVLRIGLFCIFLAWQFIVINFVQKEEDAKVIRNNVNLTLNTLSDKDKPIEQSSFYSMGGQISLIFLFFMTIFIGCGHYQPSERYNKVIEFPHKGNQKATTGKGHKRIELEAYARAWINNKDPKENIYLVAGQGGGSRAGFWIASMLNQLDKANKNFYDNLFAVSTVSGSTVGAGIFLNYKRNENENKDRPSTFDFENLKNFYTTDYVSSSVFRLLFLNPFQKIIGKSMLKNRNNQLIKEENDSFLSNFYDNQEDIKYNHYSPFPIIRADSARYDEPLLIARYGQPT